MVRIGGCAFRPDDRPSRRTSSIRWRWTATAGTRPAWSRKRQPYAAPAFVKSENTVPYAELHCHTNFSFLDGASHPEELAEEAARLGLEALAVTDHDGFYGVVRFSQAAHELALPTIFGAELSLDLSKPQNGEADPEGRHLLALAHGPEGYARLARTISRGQLRGEEKGKPDYGDLEQIAEVLRDHVLVLTGCRKGSVPRALATGGTAAAAAETRPAGRPVRAGQRGGRADRPRRPLRRRPQRRAGRDRPQPPPARGRHQQRALRDARPAQTGDRAGRRPGPAQPRRAGRLAARGRRRPPAQRRRDGPPVRRLPGRRRAGRRLRPRPGVRPASWWRPSCPTSRCPTGTPT